MFETAKKWNILPSRKSSPEVNKSASPFKTQVHTLAGVFFYKWIVAGLYCFACPFWRFRIVMQFEDNQNHVSTYKKMLILLIMSECKI